MSETAVELRAFHPDQILARDGNVITVEELTMSGPYRVQWTVVNEEGTHIVAQRTRRTVPGVGNRYEHPDLLDGGSKVTAEELAQTIRARIKAMQSEFASMRLIEQKAQESDRLNSALDDIETLCEEHLEQANE